MRRILDWIFGFLYGKKSFYGFFYFLYIRGLKGIELYGNNFAIPEISGETKVIELLKQIDKPVIIDGGANLGQYALLCNGILGKNATIYSFEPSDSTYQNLKNKVSSFPNILAYKLALSDKPQKLTLFSDTDNSIFASVIECNFEGEVHLDQKEEIEATSIDQFLSENNIEHVDLLKLDIEGYELTALKGAYESIQKDKIKIIQFEMGRTNIESHTFFKDFYVMLSDKYQFYRIVSFGFQHISQYSIDYEIFNGSNFMAVHKQCNITINDVL